MKSLKERVEDKIKFLQYNILIARNNQKGKAQAQEIHDLFVELYSRNEELEIFFKENSHQLERQSKLIERYREALEYINAESENIEVCIGAYEMRMNRINKKAKQALNDEEVKG